MYWLTLISSIAGIASLIISFTDIFKKWKPYILYFSCFAIGITVGIIMSMAQSAIQQFTTGQLFYLITLVSVVSFVIFFIYRFLTVSHDPLFITVIVFVILGVIGTGILKKIDQSQSFLKASDYMTLSRHYESSGDYIRAADFLDRYKEFDGDNLSYAMEDSLKKKSAMLRLKAVK